MPSRQDQLHSYQYSQQRVVSALVSHDPDPHRSPLRRAGTTVLVSLVVAAVALCGAAVYGMLTNAKNTDLGREDVVYLDEESGARYVYLKQDQQLHPVLNYTSGLLIATGSKREMVGTTGRRLSTIAIGARLGIPDAPDSLPRSADLVKDPWSICTSQPAGRTTPASTLLVGKPPTDGVLAQAAGVALLVVDNERNTYMVHGNLRFAIPRDKVEATKSTFGWNDRQAFPVATAWINAVPMAGDLVPPAITGFGSRGWDGRPIGQLLTDPDGTSFAVVLADGTAAITQVQAKLMQTNAKVEDPVTLTKGVFANLPRSRTKLSTSDTLNGPPSTVPPLAGTPRSLCLTLPVPTAPGQTGGVRIDPAVPAGLPAAMTSEEMPQAACPGSARVSKAAEVVPQQADLIAVPRGKGALVAAAAAPGAGSETGAVSVVTDVGRRYPLASRELVGKLAFGAGDVRPVPAELVALLPQGPALDPALARQFCP